MAGWRDIKRKALKDIHRTFEIPAVYMVSATVEPVRVNIRLHQRHAISENTLAAWGNAASLLDMVDRVVFTGSEVENVLSRSYIIFGAEECFLTGPSKPPREGYTFVEVTPVSKADLADFLQNVDVSHPAFKGIL